MLPKFLAFNPATHMIVIVHQGALGDWVLTFPILRALPSEPLMVVTSPGKGRLAMRVRAIASVHDAESAGWSRLFGESVTPDDALLARDGVAATLDDASLIVSFVTTGRDAWAANVRELAPGAKLVAVAPRPPEDWTEHVTDWHRAQLRAQGIALPSTAGPRERHNPAGPIVVHPGSGGREKCWPIERFESLIATLRASGTRVTPVLGEVEMDRWPRETSERWNSRLGAVMIDSLDTLAGLLTSARLFIGNDSGPTHLAAQLGVPTITFFGPTLPNVWQPIGPRVRVVAPPRPLAMDWLTPDSAFEVVMAMLKSPAA